MFYKGSVKWFFLSLLNYIYIQVGRRIIVVNVDIDSFDHMCVYAECCERIFRSTHPIAHIELEPENVMKETGEKKFYF